jgi:hypothetical protein
VITRIGPSWSTGSAIVITRIGIVISRIGDVITGIGEVVRAGPDAPPGGVGRVK